MRLLKFRPLLLQVVIVLATTFCGDRRLAVVKAQTTNDEVVGDCEAEGNAVAFCISSDPQNSCLTACDGNFVPDFAQLSMNDLMDPNVLCPIYQDTLCFIVDCCPLCQAEARLLYECQAAQINNEAEFCGNILSVDECDGSSLTNGEPTTDTEGGGTTVGQPSDTVDNLPPEDCEAEGNAVAECISADPENSCLTACDGNIVPDFADVTMNDLMDPNVLCPIYQDTLCLIVDCCPLCQAEARLLYECQAAQINNEAEFCGDILSVDKCDGSPTNSGGTDTQDEPTTDTEDGGTTVGEPEVGDMDNGDDLPPEDCEAEGNAVAFCLSADPQNSCLSICGADNAYTPDYTGLTMGDLMNPAIVCPIWQDALCVIVDCCPVCRSEAQLLYECQAKQINNEFCGDILSDSKCDGSSSNNVGGGGGGGGDAATSLMDSSLLPCLGLILGAVAGLN